MYNINPFWIQVDIIDASKDFHHWSLDLYSLGVEHLPIFLDNFHKLLQVDIMFSFCMAIDSDVFSNPNANFTFF